MLIKLGVALVVLLGLPGLAVYWAMAPSDQIYGTITTHGSRSEKTVALTFDDGPNNPWTLRIANALDGYGVKGTFFIIGKNADVHPEVVKALVNDGHLVGNHSYQHRKRDAVFQFGYGELDKAQKAIARAAGVCPAFYRAPNGFHTPWQLHAVSSHHMRAIGWDVQPNDWAQSDPKVIVKSVLKSVESGSIIVLHDGGDTKQGVDRSVTLNALPGIIQGLRAKGYRFVRLDQLLGARPYLSTCAGQSAAA